MKFLILALMAGPIAITVESGTIKTEAGNEIQIGPGTYIPSPEDKQLAKKIIWYKTEIENLKVMISTLEEKLARREKHVMDIDKMWGDSYAALDVKYKVATGWWNQWGKPLLIGVVCFAGGSAVTYLIVEKL